MGKKWGILWGSKENRLGCGEKKGLLRRGGSKGCSFNSGGGDMLGKVSGGIGVKRRGVYISVKKGNWGNSGGMFYRRF